MTNKRNPSEFDTGAVCDFRLLCREMLQATIPARRLKDATAVSVDQTAFPTFFRSLDFRTQKEIDRTVRDSQQQTGHIPNDVQLGPDGKLIRCCDPDARAGHRSASAATGHKATVFVGYQATFAVLVRSATAPTTAPVPGYIAGMSVDPASCHPGLAARSAVEDALAIAPGIIEVLTDMGISQYGEAFVRPMHRLRLDVVRDLKSNEAPMKVITVGTGKHRQHLLSIDGMFFPTWLPEHFKQLPEGLTDAQTRDWHKQRAKYRWTRNQTLDNDSMQFRCPQCAGRVTTNLATHRKHPRPNQSAPFVKVDHHDDKCCRGLATIPVDMLDHWQQTPWGTPAWKKSYTRRLQVENVNSMVKHNGGLDPAMCRVRGLGAHTLAALVTAIAHNLRLAKSDPDADDANDSTDPHNSSHDGEHDTNPPDGHHTHSAGTADPTADHSGDNPLRAPP